MSNDLTPRRATAPVPAARPSRRPGADGDGPGRRGAAGDDPGRRAVDADGAGRGVAGGDRPAAPSDAKAGPPTAAVVMEMLKSKIGNVLTHREREILKLRCGIDDGQTYTAEEVGRVFRITPERVRQIEAKAIRKLGRADATVPAAPRPCRRARAEAESGPGRGAAGESGPGRRVTAGDDPAHRAPAEDDAGRPQPQTPGAPTPAELLRAIQQAAETILKAADLLVADAQAGATLAGLPPPADCAAAAEYLGRPASDTVLAARHHIPLGALRKRLARFRHVDLHCFSEVANRRPREPQFLYHEQRIMPVIVALQTGSHRPAKKLPADFSPVSGVVLPPGAGSERAATTSAARDG